MLLLIACIGVLIIGIIVFGGGQVFMPLFKSLWELMSKNGANINHSKIEDIFAISNATPGVVSTKLATFTGYLSANGEWWGWFALILTYLIFTIPSIIIVYWSFKFISKTDTSKYLKNILIFLRPVIVGILLALALQLFIATAFPSVVFNSSSEYLAIDKTTPESKFFSGWRIYALISYSIIVPIETFYFYKIKKVNLFILIISHIVVGMILFEPWL